MREKKARTLRKTNRPLTVEQFITAVTITDQLLYPEERLARPTGTPSPWRSSTPTLLRYGAKLLGNETEELGGFSFDEDTFTETHDRIIDLERAREACLQDVATIDQVIAFHKDRGATWLGQLHDAVQYKLGDPTRVDKGTLPINAQPFLGQIALINAQTTGRRRSTLDLKAEVQKASAERDRMDLELRTSRGGTLTLEELRPAARSATRRRTPRR